ncbi:hypothetical protein BDK51DRAFT_50029 [Blyttiomyces helicus]|uniref:Uncharacterized protein n=1 Tax=Blyttiomyces helicus TaxID=388810 RepID=A0A4P9VUR8_9FUNG|nr:hypothetical protein BDK51DRAFT_50029 [Blyttiomyces helicus]|eukprot:RKO83344.1 hypothetical protein BDK51DRAFT_50029 [Blyttiomyces helicus]
MNRPLASLAASSANVPWSVVTENALNICRVSPELGNCKGTGGNQWQGEQRRRLASWTGAAGIIEVPLFGPCPRSPYSSPPPSSSECYALSAHIEAEEEVRRRERTPPRLERPFPHKGFYELYRDADLPLASTQAAWHDASAMVALAPEDEDEDEDEDGARGGGDGTQAAEGDVMHVAAGEVTQAVEDQGDGKHAVAGEGEMTYATLDEGEDRDGDVDDDGDDDDTCNGSDDQDFDSWQWRLAPLE